MMIFSMLSIFDPVITDRRQVFMAMLEKQRFETLFMMLENEISERVKLQARLLTLENDNKHMERELNGISHRKTDTLDVMSTGERIQLVINKRYGWIVDDLRKVIVNVITLIVIALLSVAFWKSSGGVLP